MMTIYLNGHTNCYKLLQKQQNKLHIQTKFSILVKTFKYFNPSISHKNKFFTSRAYARSRIYLKGVFFIY